MKLEYKKQTDEVHEIKLDSKITHAVWGKKTATAGDVVELEVRTHFVGNGSEIKIKVKDKKGKTVEKLKGKVWADEFICKITIPEKAKEELIYTAKLPKHGLEMKSEPLKVIPLIKVTNMKWSQKEARRGDEIKLTADVEGVSDDTEGRIIIYEYDQDGAHDQITRFSCKVKNKKVEAGWIYEYFEDTDDIPTDEELKKSRKSYNPPEYYFVIEILGQRFGEKQESGLLEFKDWIEIKLVNKEGNPASNENYILYLPDGQQKKGKLDEKGYAMEKDIPPGKVTIEFPDLET